MNIISRYKTAIISIFVLMLLATFYDYQLAVFISNNFDTPIFTVFYKFFAIFGEFTFTFVFVLMFGLFFNFSLRSKKSTLKNFKVVINGFFLIGFSILQFLSFARYLAPAGGHSHGNITTSMFIYSIVLGFILAFCTNHFMYNIDETDYKYYRKIAILGVLYIIILTFAVNGIKILWGRPRFWVVEDGLSSFVPWYYISGIKNSTIDNSYMSFVSEHTANGFAAIFLSLWSIENRNNWYTFGIVWGFCVAISRLFAKQHFLSDIVIGGVVAILLFIAFLKIFKLNKE